MQLVGVLADNSLARAAARARHYRDRVDVFELRLDCLASWDLTAIADFQASLQRPLILTLRPPDQGGHFKASETQRLSWLQDLANLEPAYLDLEYTVPSAVIETIHQNHPKIKLIGSVHVLDSTPEDLSDLLEKLSHPAFAIKKVITTAQSSLDGLRLLKWRKGMHNQSHHWKLVAHAMGDYGVPSRILGAALGNCFTYAYLPDPPEFSKGPKTFTAAPGLIDLDSLLQIYQIRRLNDETQFFGILGSPVRQSLGHVLHNRVFEQQGFNGVYVKWDVKDKELSSFITRMKGLPFIGFSITTPLKEAVCPYLDSKLARDENVSAYNTLRVTDKGLVGCNTDGLGVLRTLEDAMNAPLKGQTILLLGAGGAARGIAFALAQAGANLIIINRSLPRAQKLANDVGRQQPKIQLAVYDFDSLATTAVIQSTALVNALAGEAKLPDSLLHSLAANLSLYVLDINCFYPNRALVDLAKLGWKIIPGLDTYYFEQAYEQLRFWGVLSPNQVFNCDIKLPTPSFLVEEKD